MLHYPQMCRISYTHSGTKINSPNRGYNQWRHVRSEFTGQWPASSFQSPGSSDKRLPVSVAALLVKRYFNRAGSLFPGYNSAAQTRRVDQRYDHAIAHAKTKLIRILNRFTPEACMCMYVRNVHTSRWPTTESLSLNLSHCLSLSLSFSLSIILIFPSLSRQLLASIPLFWTVALHNCDTQPISC